VLIIGGGGSIGSFTIQLAKHLGAEVTAVDGPAKVELMRSLGADKTADYTRENITKSKERFDLIIDVVGKRGLLKRLQLLKPAGIYFLGYARPRDLLLSLWLSLTGKKRLRITSANQEQADLDHLSDLLEKEILQPQVDKVFRLENAAKAHKFAESGEKKGHIVLRIGD
jgi:NADPH:quinone reductase-like Zn-dependent oxidoreductase